jgi:hypothetical protein
MTRCVSAPRWPVVARVGPPPDPKSLLPRTASSLIRPRLDPSGAMVGLNPWSGSLNCKGLSVDDAGEMFLDARVLVPLLAAAVAGCTMPNPAFSDPRTSGVGGSGSGGRAAVGETGGTAADAGTGGLSRQADLGSVVDLGSEADLGSVVDLGSVADLAPDRGGDSAPDVPPAPSRRVVIADANATNQYGGSGGSGRSDRCGGNEVLIGFRGYTGLSGSLPVVSGLQPQCGTLEVTGGHPYVITAKYSKDLPATGGSASSPFDASCPAGKVLVSFFGRTGSSLEQVGFRCAALIVSDDAALTVSLGTVTTFGPFPTSAGGTAFDQGCGPVGVAVGQQVNQGAWIDSLGLHCGRPSLAP